MKKKICLSVFMGCVAVSSFAFAHNVTVHYNFPNLYNKNKEAIKIITLDQSGAVKAATIKKIMVDPVQ